MTLRARSLVVIPVLVFALVCACGASLRAAEMITRTFKIPADFLSCEMPDEGAPADARAPVDPFAPAGPPATTPVPETRGPPKPRPARAVLEGMGIPFPEGASAIFNPVAGTLTVTNTQENMEVTAAFVAQLEEQSPANVAFTVTVVEAPGGLIHEADAAATKTANAAAALATLLEQAKQAGSNVRVVGNAFLETRSGTRATVEAVLEHSHASEFQLDAKSQASVVKELQQSGLSLEIEPTVGADGATVEVTFSLMLNAAPPTQRQISVNDPLTGHVAEFPVTDVPGARFTSGISTSNGHTRLIGITKPVGTLKQESDTLWAAFLTTTLRRVVALPGREPEPKVAAPAAVPPGMLFATLPAPEGLFAEVLGRPPALTLQSWLSRAGITFPAGASTQQKDGLLHVLNTADNIGLIAAVVEHELAARAMTVALTLHTLEAPAALLRELTRQTLTTADDTAMFAAVEAAVARGEARFIDSGFVETKSSTRATHAAGREHAYFERFRTDDKGRPVSSFETRLVGTHFEVEPTIGADNRTVELTFAHELHPTGPVLRHDHFRDPASGQPFEMPVTDFHSHKTVTSISVSKGGTKLIALNQPTGRGDNGMLWATFLKCDVVPQVSKPQAQQQERPQAQADPAKDPRSYLIEKMNRIIFPSVTFQHTPVEEAIEFLRVKSRELDTLTKDSSLKGVGIVLRFGEVPSKEHITLDLKDVPMSEALRYVTELAQMTYEVEEHAVLVQPRYLVADMLHTRTFRVPPGFLSIGGDETGNPRKSVRQILEAQGITFPEGASASINPPLSMLFVRNTNDNLDLVEAFFDTVCHCPPKTVILTTHLMQGPAPLLRRIATQAATKSNHRAELEELLAAAKAGTVQHLDTARIETKAGTRATADQGTQHGAITEVSVNEKGQPLITQQTRHVGLHVEVEPLVGADGVTVELELAPEFHSAPPLEHREHIIDTQGRRHEFPLTDYHTAKVTTSITIPDGSARLLSLHRPTGKPEFEKEDVLQVMFITCDVVSLAE